MVQKKTILIVDDHPLFREGLKTIITSDTRYEVIGEAGNGREALRLAKKHKPTLNNLSLEHLICVNMLDVEFRLFIKCKPDEFWSVGVMEY